MNEFVITPETKAGIEREDSICVEDSTENLRQRFPVGIVIVSRYDPVSGAETYAMRQWGDAFARAALLGANTQILQMQIGQMMGGAMGGRMAGGR